MGWHDWQHQCKILFTKHVKNPACAPDSIAFQHLINKLSTNVKIFCHFLSFFCTIYGGGPNFFPTPLRVT